MSIALTIAVTSRPAEAQFGVDECASITETIGYGQWPFDTSSATTSSDPFTDSQCSGTLLGDLYHDLWFEFVAPVSGDVEFETCGLPSFDSDLVIYEGSCGSLNQLACNGDGCAGELGDPFASRVTISVEVDQSYFIRIGGYSTAQDDDGPGVLTITPINCELAKIVPPSAQSGDQFGRSAALDGDVTVWGANRADDNGNDSGAVRVYRQIGATWVEEQKLLASDGAAVDLFGVDVGIDGDVIIVGSQGSDGVTADAGAAYVYRHDGSSWIEEQKLVASDGEPSGAFGSAVAVSGDIAVIGSYVKDDAGTNSGAAYVFRHDGTSWIEEQKLIPSAGLAAHDWFGNSVAIDNEVIVVGSPEDQQGLTLPGSAYVYRYDGTTWVEEAQLTASDPGAGDRFGFEVALDGDVVVVGARGDDTPATDAGSAYVFRHEAGVWTEEAKLVPVAPGESEVFGGAVAIDGSVITISAPGRDNGRGSVFVYRHDGAVWTDAGALTASDAADSAFFGSSLAIDGDVISVGARLDSEAALFSGAGYLFATPGGTDCDQNGQVDLCDILAGESLDVNDNGIPDECESPVLDLTCVVQELTIELSWTNDALYDSVEVYRDGTWIGLLSGTATTFLDESAPGGIRQYAVVGIAEGSGLAATCIVFAPAFVLSLTTDDAFTGGQASVTVLLDVPTHGAAQGWSYGLCQVGDGVTAAGGTIGSDAASVNNGFPPDFESINVEADGVTHAVILSFTDPDTVVLPAGVDYEILEATFDVADSPGLHSVVFCETLGDPVVINTISSGGLDRFPIAFGTAITVETLFPVSGLSCGLVGESMQLTWTNSNTYELVRVLRNGVEIAELPGSATSYTDLSAPPGYQTYEVVGGDATVVSTPVDCSVLIPIPPVTGLNCAVGDECTLEAELSWALPSNLPPGGYDSISITLDGTPTWTTAGNAFGLSEDPASIFPGPGTYEVCVIGLIASTNPANGRLETLSSSPLCCTVTVDPPPTATSPTELACTADPVADTADISWTNTSTYADLEVFVDGVSVALLPGRTTSTTVPLPTSGTTVEVCLRATTTCGEVAPDACCTVTLGTLFRRGDANNDGAVNIADTIRILDYLFLEQPVDCLLALDANDDNGADIGDSIFVLSFLFTDGPAPPSPFPSCGIDSTPGAPPLSCESSSCP